MAALTWLKWVCKHFIIASTQHKLQCFFFLSYCSDRSPQMKACAQILKNFGYLDVSSGERLLVRQVCTTISARAAHLCASGVAALVLRSRDIEQRISGADQFRVTVAVDGTVYKKHPRYARLADFPVSLRLYFPFNADSFFQQLPASPERQGQRAVSFVRSIFQTID